ncbi:MAG TPA: ABC transporter, partial [Planctomycetaceae bacterium]|nr:ABC transporter [Planctomycetaceae bacterium]
AIDAESEDLIHGALKEFSHGRTVFIITHALSRSFLDLVDRVVVMEQGQISASGTHEDLLKSSETYRRLSTAGAQAASPDREAA